MCRSVLKRVGKKVSRRNVFNLILLISFLLTSILIVFFPSIISHYYQSMKYKNPVRWQGIDIQFPKGTAYFFEDDKSIVFWRPHTADHVYIYPHQGTKEEIIEFLKKKERSYKRKDYEIINSNMEGKGGFFELETVDDKSVYYEKFRCYPNFCIDYSGSRGDEYGFLSIVEDFEKKIRDINNFDSVGKRVQ